MKLNDLIVALADEVDLMQPQLNQFLDKLATLDSSSDDFMTVLDQYNDYAHRMGEAAEMVGFTGLQTICMQVQENTLLLAIYEPDERKDLLKFLHAWPTLMSHYLRNLDDPSVAAGLVDHLLVAPVPFEEEQALKVMHQLGVMALKANAPKQLDDDTPARQTQATPEDVTLDVPADVDQRLLEGFLQESPEMALNLVAWAQQLAEQGTVEADAIKAAKRMVHTIKGTGATIGLRGLASLGHHVEDILEYLQEHTTHVNTSVANVILDAAYCLEQMVGYIAGMDDFPEQSQQILQQVLDLANKIDKDEPLEISPVEQKSATPTSTDETQQQNTDTNTLAKTPTARPAVNAAAALRVPLEKVDELFRVSGEISVHSAAMEAKIKNLSDHAKSLLAQNLRLQKRLFELETLVDVRALSMMRGHSNQANTQQSGFDPLEMAQYNELHSTAHALVEEAADARVVAHFVEEDIANLSAMQTRQHVLSRDLQHLVIGTRMAEVGGLESRLQRNIRITCQNTGKQAKLVMTGKDTLIDSDVLNRLAEPLLHLLRNAVDHGIELPDEREVAGKAPRGTVYLDFFRQGQQVVLRCEDDGRGLNLAAIRQRAIERGVITQAQTLSDEEITQLILLSGFSTRDSVSEISGRGVGLDVVREWVNTMNGTMSVRQGDKGCLIELRFAASLSTIQSLVVKVADALIAIPSVQIEQAVPRSVGQFRYLNDKLIYYFDKKAIPAYLLANMAGLASDSKLPLADYDAVIVRLNNQRYALAVNELIDARELLVKNPGRYAKHLTGITGLSILGNGNIVVNVDVVQLLAKSQAVGLPQVSAEQKSATIQSNLPNVLVIDDALTVRNSLQQLLQDTGSYGVKTARDGIEAINVLNNFTPSIVLTDLEMPNMNGIEFSRHIRNRDDLKDIPIVMITSRSQDKHKQLADQVGIDVYITKPYNDLDLLKTIKQLL